MFGRTGKVLSGWPILLYLFGLVTIAGCGGGDDNNPTSSNNAPRFVALTEPIHLSASSSLFSTAEILNAFSDNQILKVVMPDSSVLYRDLNTNRVWKEKRVASSYVAAETLSESELNLILSLDLDTGWKPSSGPFQVRFILRASQGKLSASLDGEMTLNSTVTPGDSLDGTVGVTGTETGGTVHIEGGLEIACKYKIGFTVPIPWVDDFKWSYTGDIPYFPNADWGVFNDSKFTPYAFGSSVGCDDDIDDQDVTFPIVGLPKVLSLNAGALIGGRAEGTFYSDSLYCTVGNKHMGLCTDGECASFKVAKQADSTMIDPSFTYAARGHVKWVMTIKPAGKAVVKVDVPLVGDITKDFTLSVGSIPVTIFNSNVSMKFNTLHPEFVITGTK